MNMNMDPTMTDEVDQVPQQWDDVSTGSEDQQEHDRQQERVLEPYYASYVQEGETAETAAAASEALDTTPNFFDWQEHYPELGIFLDHLHEIQEEVRSVPNCPWTAWPENHAESTQQEVDWINDNLAESEAKRAESWTVIPFLHTFPATDASASQWIEPCTRMFPATTRLLRSLPNVRTALFSRLKPNTKLAAHTGWEDLANYVLRCHVCIDVPPSQTGTCGLYVNGDVQFHEEGRILVFDDSKTHYAFNNSQQAERIVLIIDMLRPDGVELGHCTGGHTMELNSFIDQFR